MVTAQDVTCIADVAAPLPGAKARTPHVIAPEPNINLLASRTLVPQLICTLEPGEWAFGTWVHDGRHDLGTVLPALTDEPLPDVSELHAMREGGQVIRVWDLTAT